MITDQERDRDVVAMLRRWAEILRDVKPDKAAQADRNADVIEALIDEEMNDDGTN